DVTPDRYWAMSRSERADLIWTTLFVDNTPLSEAARGVVAVLTALGLDPAAPLADLRAYFGAQDLQAHVPRVLELAGISDIVMTNDPLDSAETAFWDRNAPVDRGFHAALRLDRILNDWQAHVPLLQSFGYAVEADASGKSAGEIRRFLE